MYTFIKHILIFCIVINVHEYDPMYEYFKIIEYSIAILTFKTFSNAYDIIYNTDILYKYYTIVIRSDNCL